METITTERDGIFGLRYLEEDEAQIHDVVGCMAPPTDGGGGVTTNTASACDRDTDLGEP